jgi:membrane associated rhomboid family serine protease
VSHAALNFAGCADQSTLINTLKCTTFSDVQVNNHYILGLLSVQWDPFRCPILARSLITIFSIILSPVIIALGLVLGLIAVLFYLPGLIYASTFGYEGRICDIISIILAGIICSPFTLVVVVLATAVGLVGGIIFGIPYLLYLKRKRRLEGRESLFSSFLSDD